MRYSKNRYGIIVLSIIFILIIFIPIRSYTLGLINRVNHYLPNNLYINGIHVGGQTIEEAEQLLNKIESEHLRKEITIIYEDGNSPREAHSFTYKRLGCYGDKAPILKDLKAILSRNINVLSRIPNYIRIERKGQFYKMKFNINKKQFFTAMEAFDDTLFFSPEDAKYSIANGKVEIIEEKNGFIFDKEALYNALASNSDAATAKLKTKLVAPKVTAQQLSQQGVKEKISSFTTKFDAGNAPRASNIKLAAQIIEGKVLAPGDIFSFNNAVGQRTEERGFKEAGVYMNGKVDTGIGGGICQVSTTLYNTVLYADLEVLERHNHSLTVPYVPLSRDAAVSWGLQDFKFVNNTDYHIYIHASTTRNTITFDLYSTKSDKKVELISTAFSKVKAPVLYKDDAALEVGKQTVEETGHDGYESRLIKKVFVEGKLVSTGIVSKDKYLTSPKIVIRGTKMPVIMPRNYPIYE